MIGVICMEHSELAEQQPVISLVAVLGLAVLSCLNIYCVLAWLQCNDRPTVSSVLVMISLAAWALAALAVYCRLSSGTAIHKQKHLSVILLTAFLASMVIISYIDNLRFSCSRIDPVVRGGHTVELLQDD